jgi:hypothetical protein
MIFEHGSLLSDMDENVIHMNLILLIVGRDTLLLEMKLKRRNLSSKIRIK